MSSKEQTTIEAATLFLIDRYGHDGVIFVSDMADFASQAIKEERERIGDAIEKFVTDRVGDWPDDDLTTFRSLAKRIRKGGAPYDQMR